MAMNIKKRLLAVLLCLVLVVCVVVQPVYAAVAIPIIAGGIVISYLLLTAAGVTFPSADDAQRAASQFISSLYVEGAYPGTAELKVKFNAACAGYIAQGIQGLNSVLTIDNLKAFFSHIANLGYNDNGGDVNFTAADGVVFDVSGIKNSSKNVFCNPWSGGPIVWYTNGAWGNVILGTPSSSPAGGLNTTYSLLMYSLNDYMSTGSMKVLSSFSYTTTDTMRNYFDYNGYSVCVFTDGSVCPAVKAVDKSTGAVVCMGDYFNGSPAPYGTKFSSLATAVSSTMPVNYSAAIGAVQDKVKSIPVATPARFTSVPTAPAAGLTSADVIDLTTDLPVTSGTTSEVTSTPATTFPTADAIGQSVATNIGTQIASWFVPSATYLSGKFNTLLSKFPQNNDLSALEPLKNLGEKKPKFTVNLENYFGITTSQDAISIDIWEDKRSWIKFLVRGVVIILLVIYNYNMLVKMIRGTTFSDTGSGQSAPVATGGLKPPRGD